MTFSAGFQNVKVKGHLASASEAPVLVCAPHSSFFDTFTFFRCLHLPSGVSKEENGSYPILGCRYSTCVF